MSVVDGEHCNVILQIYEEGMHVMVPWFEWPIIYDVRAKPVNIQSVSGSKDLQTVRLQAIALHELSMQDLHGSLWGMIMIWPSGLCLVHRTILHQVHS